MKNQVINLRPKQTFRHFFAGCAVICLLLTCVISLWPTEYSVLAEKVKKQAITRNSVLPRSTLVQRLADASQTHVLAASYYNFKAGLDAKLMLSNQGPRQMPITISLFRTSGEQLNLEPITLHGNEVRIIDIRESVRRNAGFDEGSIQVTYDGNRLELGGVVLMINTKRSLIFDEELSEPTKDFRSSRLEAVWWLPSPKAQMQLAFSNTSSSPLSATFVINGPTSAGARRETLALGPHETRLIDTGKFLRSRFGGISVEHSGASGALLARGLVQEPKIGFSSAIEFRDPARAKSLRLDGVGLRLGEVQNEELQARTVARNVSASPTLLSGRIVYSTADGVALAIPLPDMHLGPGETKELNLSAVLKDRGINSDVTAAGLEFQYSGVPGDVIISTLSVSNSGDHVFRVPLVDAKTPSSSTGTYPWSIDADSSTVVYVKNVTDQVQQYTMQINYAGGTYPMDIQKLQAGQSSVVDLRKLRDQQVANRFGQKLPLNVSAGQVHWSVEGPVNHVLIGRSEQADLAGATSMTAACGTCCPDSTSSVFITPDAVAGFPNDSQQFAGMYFRRDCYNNPPNGPFQADPLWSSLDTNVAICDSSGVATALNPGFTNIRAEWEAPVWWLDDAQPVEVCMYDPFDAVVEAFCDVFGLDVSFTTAKLLQTNQEANFSFNVATLNLSSSIGPNACAGDTFVVRARFDLPQFNADCCSGPDNNVVLNPNNKFSLLGADFFENESHLSGFVDITLKRTNPQNSSNKLAIHITGRFQNNDKYIGLGILHLSCP